MTATLQLPLLAYESLMLLYFCPLKLWTWLGFPHCLLSAHDHEYVVQ